MTEKQMTIREFLFAYETDSSGDVGLSAWYDWFCRESSLRNKTKFLVNRLKTIVDSPKIDKDRMYVFFKNNCPVYGSLYDDFRICDLETGEVLFCVVPSSGYNDEMKNKPFIAGKFNDYESMYFENWNQLKKWFMEN